MQLYHKRSRRDVSPLAYLSIGLVIGLFVMGIIWSVFGTEAENDASIAEQEETTNTETGDVLAMQPVMPVVDFSQTNCTSLEDFRDAVNAEVDTGLLPALSKPYRKASVDKARKTALAWASDAVWTKFAVGFPAEGAAPLSYSYYSPTQAKTVLISFGATGASVNSPVTSDIDKSFSPTDVINANLWQVTLADAWATAYAQVRPSCATWWQTTSALGWNIFLHMKESALVWEFNFFDMTSPDTAKWTITVDATKGTIVSKSWSDTETTPTTSGV